MHSYLKDLAFACIGLGAVFCVPALLLPARVHDPQPHRRHGRAQAPVRTRGEGWPDLRTCLTVMAIGASLLADQWTDHRARLLLSIPVFAVLIWNVVSWLVSSARRRSAGQQAARAGYQAARYGADPRYQGDSRRPAAPRYQGDSRRPADPRYRGDSRGPADPRYPADPRSPGDLPYRHQRGSPADPRNPSDRGSPGERRDRRRPANYP
jgi:hypothetical protein